MTATFGNPLDGMTWEERFHAAFLALLQMEMKYDDACAEIKELRMGNGFIAFTSSLIKDERTGPR